MFRLDLLKFDLDDGDLNRDERDRFLLSLVGELKMNFRFGEMNLLFFKFVFFLIGLLQPKTTLSFKFRFSSLSIERFWLMTWSMIRLMSSLIKSRPVDLSDSSFKFCWLDFSSLLNSTSPCSERLCSSTSLIRSGSLFVASAGNLLVV